MGKKAGGGRAGKNKRRVIGVGARVQNAAIAAVAASIIAGAGWYGYTAEQGRQAGFVFGNELLQIQEDLAGMQREFGGMVSRWEDGEVTARQFAEFAARHAERMEGIAPRYDALDPPEAFGPSVAVFKLSLESQIRSDAEFAAWVRTGDVAHRIRSDALIQEAFEYETRALGEFNRAKMGISGGG